MPFKWDENTTIKFLSAYENHPCLWNPYNAKYYDCIAKNIAFQKIIKELDLPELTIDDCLNQIKVIREKYKQEQLRTIRELQCQNSYISPYLWYDLIANMLMKVIEDENKQYSKENLKSASLEIYLDTNKSSMQTKSASYNSSTKRKKTKSPERKPKSRISVQKNNSQKETKSLEKEGVSSQKHKKQNEIHSINEDSFKVGDSFEIKENSLNDRKKENHTKLRRSSGLSKNDYSDFTLQLQRFSRGIEHESTINENSQINILECPACGWDYSESFNDKENKSKAPVSYSNYFGNLPNQAKNICSVLAKNKVENKQEIKKHQPSCSCVSTEKDMERKNPCNEEKFKSTSLKFSSREGIVEFSPEVVSKFEDGVLEAYSQFRVVLPKLVQAELAEKRSQDIQTCRNTKQQSVATSKFNCISKDTQCPSKHLLAEQKCDCKLQNTVCLSSTDLALLLRQCLPCHIAKNIETNNVMTQCSQEAQRKDCFPCEKFRQFLEQCDQEAKFTEPTRKISKTNSCVRFSLSREIKSNFVQCDNKDLQGTVCVQPKDYINIQKNPESFVLFTPSGKFVPLMKIESEAERTVVPCDNNANINKNIELEDPAEREACTNAAEIEKGSPVIIQVLLHCLDKMISLEKKALAKSGYSSSETLDCTCSEEVEVRKTTGVLTKTFLEVVKRALELDNKADFCTEESC